MTKGDDFDAIRARAAERKGGADVLASLLAPAPGNAALASIGDDRVLAEMTKCIFRSGFVWKVINDKWPGFEEAFLGFEPGKLAIQPDEYWEGLAKNAAIVRNPQKIAATRHNAAYVMAVAGEHGSFGRFLADWPGDDQIGLMASLAKGGKRLGGRTAQYFLRFIGWDSFILSGDVVTALRDAGLEIAEQPSSKRDLAAIQARFNAWRGETGLPYTHLARILAMSVGENYAPDVIRARGGMSEEG